MEPTLRDGSMVLASSIPYFLSKPSVGDIAAFWDKRSKKICVKRIKGAKDNSYFLAGDNKKDSIDSIQLGWIARKYILGKVIYVFKD